MMCRHLSAVGFIPQHSQSGVGKISQDVHRLPLQQEGLLHELLLALHQQLDRLSQNLQGLRHGGEEHPAGPLLLEALRRQLGHVVGGPVGGRSGRERVRQVRAWMGGTFGWED